MEVIEREKERCAKLIRQISSDIPKRTAISSSSINTLLRLAHSELNFLSLLRSPPSSLSTNVGHLESVVHLLISNPAITAVSRVCKPIPIHPNNSEALQVDIVCSLHGLPAWIVVSDRNPKNVEDQCFVHRIRRLLNLATSEAPLAARPSAIVIFFSRGLENRLFDTLQKEFQVSDLKVPKEVLGSDLECSDIEDEFEGWVKVKVPSAYNRSYEEARVLQMKLGTMTQEPTQSEVLRNFSSMNFKDLEMGGDSFSILIKTLREEESSGVVNFDTTALVAAVTGLSNGCAERVVNSEEEELRKRYKGNFEFVISQAQSELKSPILPELVELLAVKRGVACETVATEFMGLVKMCGGPNENLRAEMILKCLLIIPDCPSDRIMSLPTTRKLTNKNKIIFGVGDCLHCPTLTANTSFVRAIRQTGMSLDSIEHRPRALICE